MNGLPNQRTIIPSSKLIDAEFQGMYAFVSTRIAVPSDMSIILIGST
jgi:hypothetical protein